MLPVLKSSYRFIAYIAPLSLSLFFLFPISELHSAEGRQPLSGRVTTEQGQPLAGVTVYGTSGRCCPYSREQSSTDISGNFRIEHPGALLHFFKDNFQPKVILLRTEDSAIRVSLKPESDNLNVPLCSKSQKGAKRLGSGNYGLKFDVTQRGVKITSGKDIDYTRYVIRPKASKSSLQLWFGLMAMSLEPEDEQFVKSTTFEQRNVISASVRQGMDSWGQKADGSRWRWTGLPGEGGAIYENATPEDARLFDEIVNSLCEVPYRPRPINP